MNMHIGSAGLGSSELRQIESGVVADAQANYQLDDGRPELIKLSQG